MIKPLNDTLSRPGETVVFLEYPQDVHHKDLKFLCTVQPGLVAGAHRHPKMSESFKLMTAFPIELVIEGEVRRLHPDDPSPTMILPNQMHQWANTTPEPVTIEVTISPLEGQSLQDINIVESFHSYFALMNQPQGSSFGSRLTRLLRLAVSEYTFRDVSLSGSMYGRIKVFFLAQLGRLLGLQPEYSQSANGHKEALTYEKVPI